MFTSSQVATTTSSLIAAVAAVTIVLGIAHPVHAAELTPVSADASTRVIDVSHADLTDPAVRNAIEGKIVAAANTVCQRAASTSLADDIQVDACVDRALVDARRQMTGLVDAQENASRSRLAINAQGVHG